MTHYLNNDSDATHKQNNNLTYIELYYYSDKDDINSID